MKKALIAAVLLFAASQVFAAYTVVMKDGTRYQAKAKWTMVGGKALIRLENGQTLSVDPALIDIPKSEEVTRLGLGGAKVIGVEPAAQPQAQQQAPSLGSTVRMRPRAQFGEPEPAVTPQSTAPSAGAAAATVPNQLDSRLAANFERAYENIGIFERDMAGTNRVVRAEVTADNEDKVFNAISATAFLIVRNAGVDGVEIEKVELFMKTTNGGAAGRFQMSRADAEAINSKTITIQDYYVRNVIY
ncbi:MAG TPA: hypothetical protein VFT12_11540 [Thermoanaerobaculia bacterium]|nr:hypothetical protein [Thermoanaerobaculia bacterium]